MLYPTNIKLRKKEKIQIIKENLQELREKTKKTIKYLIFDTKKLSKIILVKLHI